MTRRLPLYLDHNATTPAKPDVVRLMQEMLGFSGNPSSIHRQGRQARKIIDESRALILKAVNAGPRDVLVFTSGATEANNLALKGAGMERVIVSAVEHPSVLNLSLDKETIPVSADGVINLDALEALLAGNVRQTLISVMLANNETGVIHPVKEVAALARRYGALVHCDAVQAFGRMPLDIRDLGVDFLTLSSHKMGGPQGAGCLIVANCAAVRPQIEGGSQEKNLRAGTENLAAIAGFGRAAALLDIAAMQALGPLRDRMEQELTRIDPALVIFGKNAPRLANTSLFSTAAADSETQLIALDLAGICVSNGSACASGTVRTSHVLAAMGVPDGAARGALRVSLGWNTTPDDITAFIAAWGDLFNRTGKNAHG